MRNLVEGSDCVIAPSRCCTQHFARAIIVQETFYTFAATARCFILVTASLCARVYSHATLLVPFLFESRPIGVRCVLYTVLQLCYCRAFTKVRLIALLYIVRARLPLYDCKSGSVEWR